MSDFDSKVVPRITRGSVIAVVYLIEEVIGGGAHGSVYRATHAYLGPVALKVFFDTNDSDRLLREAKLLAQISHQGIIRIFDAGEVEIDGRLVPYLSMEHLPLGSLASLFKEEGRLHVGDALDIALQVLEAIAYLQALDPPVVHRDLVPENVLLVSRSPLKVKVGDFSLARPVPPVVGITLLDDSVLAYLPPESALGYYPATGDLYAVGVMLYAMLTGVMPYRPPQADTRVRLRDFLADRRNPPLLPSVHRREINPGIDGLVMRALAPNPQDRFPDAKTFASAVRAACAWS